MQTDKHKSDREFHLGDLVWLKLQPYKQHIVAIRGNHSFEKKMIQNPYVICVSQIKPFHRVLFPTWMNNKKPILIPKVILDRRFVKFQNKS